MNTEINSLILQSIGLVAIVLLSLIVSNIFKNIKIAEFGSDNESKRRVLMKLIANVFIFLCICLILIAGIFKIFNEQVTLLLFVSGIAALGVKVIFDIKDK